LRRTKTAVDDEKSPHGRLFTQLPTRHEPVEKVAAGSIGDPKPSSKRPKNDAFGTRTEVRKGHEGIKEN
jgi:hypothetical protein